MKNKSRILPVLLSFVGVLGYNTLFAQSTRVKKDIEDVYLQQMMPKEDSSVVAKFRRFALELFMKGEKVHDSVWTNHITSFVGVGAVIKADSTNIKPWLTLFSLRYRQPKDETDFHRRIYFGNTRRGIGAIYIKYDTEEQRQYIESAVNAYLQHDSIPITNPAYIYSRNMDIFEDDDFSKMFPSDKASTVTIGFSYSYYRRNGPYLIHIEGHPDEKTNSDTENFYVTDQFVKNTYSIAVYILKENKAAYGRKF